MAIINCHYTKPFFLVEKILVLIIEIFPNLFLGLIMN
jgi:hypothetical protein